MRPEIYLHFYPVRVAAHSRQVHRMQGGVEIFFGYRFLKDIFKRGAMQAGEGLFTLHPAPFNLPPNEEESHDIRACR